MRGFFLWRTYALLRSSEGLSQASISINALTSISNVEIWGTWECNSSLAGVVNVFDDITFYANNRSTATGCFSTVVNFVTLQSKALTYDAQTKDSWSLKDGIFSITQDAYEVCDANPKIKHDKQLALLKKTAPPGKTESFITKFINADS